MTSKDIRREKLKLWFESRSIPEKEKSYLSQLLNGKASFGERAARRLELDYGMPPLFLDSAPLEQASEMLSIQGQTNAVYVPLYEAAASMGGGASAPDHDVIVGGLHLQEAWVRQNLGAVSSLSNLALLPAYGDSMTPTFSDGDLLLVDRGVNDIRLDAVYALGLNGELFIKRLQRRPDGAILMISDNKSYEAYRIENGERDQFAVLGRVVWAWVGKKL